MRFLLCCLPLFAMLTTTGVAQGNIIYNEAIDGDLEWPEVPTALGSAGLGGNSVTGLLDNSNIVGFDPDAFWFTVPNGMQLDSLVFTSMTGDGDHFLAFNNGPLSTSDAAGNLISTLIAASHIGTNILDGSLNTYGGSGLSGGPLGAGDYYVWFQEGSPTNHDYVLSFTTSPVPEPSGGALLAAAILMLGLRRKHAAA